MDWGKKANPFVAAVDEISIYGRKKTPEELELERMRGPVVAADYRDDPRLKPPERNGLFRYGPDEDDVVPEWVANPDIPDDNRAGSYEALMAGWQDGRGRKSFI